MKNYEKLDRVYKTEYSACPKIENSEDFVAQYICNSVMLHCDCFNPNGGTEYCRKVVDKWLNEEYNVTEQPICKALWR